MNSQRHLTRRESSRKVIPSIDCIAPYPRWKPSLHGLARSNQGGSMNAFSAPCTRREILTKAVKFAGATLIPPVLIWGSPGTGGYAPKLSVEGYIWTQYFATQKETVAAGEEEALRQTHQAGYRRVELSDPFFKPEVREQTRQLLAKYALSPESVYAGTTLHEAPA